MCENHVGGVATSVGNREDSSVVKVGGVKLVKQAGGWRQIGSESLAIGSPSLNRICKSSNEFRCKQTNSWEIHAGPRKNIHRIERCRHTVS